MATKYEIHRPSLRTIDLSSNLIFGVEPIATLAQASEPAMQTSYFGNVLSLPNFLILWSV